MYVYEFRKGLSSADVPPLLEEMTQDAWELHSFGFRDTGGRGEYGFYALFRRYSAAWVRKSIQPDYAENLIRSGRHQMADKAEHGDK